MTTRGRSDPMHKKHVSGKEKERKKTSSEIPGLGKTKGKHSTFLERREKEKEKERKRKEGKKSIERH